MIIYFKKCINIQFRWLDYSYVNDYGMRIYLKSKVNKYL